MLKHYETFVPWLEVHSPLSCTDHDSLICVTNGVVSSNGVNADNAFTLGTKAATCMTSKTYSDMKLGLKRTCD